MSARENLSRTHGTSDVPTDVAQVPEVLRRLQELTHVVHEMRAALPSVMLDLRAAADYMGISTRQLRRLVADQVVPFRRMGRSLRFPMAQLTASPHSASKDWGRRPLLRAGPRRAVKADPRP
jgi:excisionase family DNA binding protein